MRIWRIRSRSSQWKDSGRPLLTSSGQDWTKVEFGAAIVRNADGTYGVYNHDIFSDDSLTSVNYAVPVGTQFMGDWHNHPENQSVGGMYEDYPSPGGATNNGINDWDALQQIKDAISSDSAFDPSEFITGPDGITREFKLSHRSYYEGLTDEQMIAGVGLDGTARQ